MKTKKRFLSILLSLVMVLGLLPGMSVMAIADGPHHIYNEISAIIPGLSITKNGTTVTDASSGDTITLTISGQPVTGTLFGETDRSIASRNIMVEGLQAYNANGTTIMTNSTGSQTWSFTMPDEDVYVAFPPLTEGEAISINAGEAAFRTGFATLNSYCFYTHKTNPYGDGDSFGYLAYKDSNGNYNYTSNDDKGGYYNFKIPGNPGVTSLAIKKSTFYHLGFAEYSAERSGTFTIPAISESMDIPFGAQYVTPQTVTAEDIEMSLGEICTIAATTDGNGTLSYKVENGDDVIDVNNSTGVITTKKTGTARVKITASGTTTYGVGNTSIKVTVNKARAIAATVNENSRTYDGTKKPLVTVDNSTLVGGTMQYALGTDSTTEPTSGWNEGIPAGTDVGTYYVWYKVKGDANHTDTEPVCIQVTISEGGTYAYISGEGSTWTKSTGLPLRFQIKNSGDNSKSFDHFKGAKVDGKPLTKDKDFTAYAYSGSVIIELKPAYLETLSVGEHTLTAEFTDGTAEAKFTVAKGEPINLPQTGDSSNVFIHVLVGLLALSGLGLVIKKR